jgi:hypothetical protein
MRRIRTGRGGRVLVCAVLLGGAACGANFAFAEPLDKDACAQLAAERDSLTKMGVKDNMAKGPEWASANLPASGLDLIKRYITVEELIKFRCRAAGVAHSASAVKARKKHARRRAAKKKEAKKREAKKREAKKKEAKKKEASRAGRKANAARAAAAAGQHGSRAAGASPSAASSAETIRATVN